MTDLHESDARRVAVIGDVGGHARHLRHCLEQLGVTERNWPADLHVIQVGDLLGGYDDLACIELAAPHIEAGRWTQLVGNWELGAIGGPLVSKGDRHADLDALAQLSSWRRRGLLHFAVAMRSMFGTVSVITHAGITHSWWVTHLDREPDLYRVVARMATLDASALINGGEMCGQPHLPPSPVWASTNELWRSWLGSDRLPWTQLHGHTTSYRNGRWMPWVDRDLISHTVKEPVSGLIWFKPNRQPPIISIDPGLTERSPLGTLEPMIIRRRL